MIKQYLVIAGFSFVVLIAVLLVTNSFTANVVKEEGPVKIGAIFQETGSGSDYGLQATRGVDLAVEKINSLDGIKGRLVKIIYEDSKSDPKDGVSALQKLMTIDDVKVVLSQQSSVVLALSPIANSNKVILMDVGSTTPLYSSPDDFTFRSSYPASYFAREIAFLLNKKNIQSIGILHVDNDYGLAMANAYKNNFNGKVVAEEKFSQDSADFRTQLEKIKSANPEVIVYTAQSTQAGSLLKQKKELGLKQPTYTDFYSIEYPAVLQTAGDAANGIIYAAQNYDINSSNPVFKDFNNDFVKKYGVISNPLSAQSYDAVMILAFVMNQCSELENTECIKNQLFEVQDFPGIIGPVSFDKNGDVKERPVALKTVKNGEFVLWGGKI
jgi:branched-chain amino acid transport system substrate-binding protein